MPKKRATPRKALAVSISVTGDRDATAAWVTMLGGPYTRDLIQAAGTSKRRAGDTYNERTGWDLAVGRALVELGLQLQADGEARVQLDAEMRLAEQLLADVRRAERTMRSAMPHPGLLSLSDILLDRGLEAAKRAARRRGDEVSLAELIQVPPSGGRGNGLPTIESGTGKEKS